MLKGHATIELTDVHTGKKEVVEHDNLITNAVSNRMNKLLPLYSSMSDFGSIFTPLYDAGMGGILLFESPLEESVNNTEFPYGNALTGYASNNVNDSTDVKRGSRNLTESMQLSNGYKYVWDFTTSQANGIISALALTHKNAGIKDGEFAIISDDRESNNSNAVYYDFENNIEYQLIFTYTSTSGMYQVTLTAYKHAFYNLSISDKFGYRTKVLEKSAYVSGLKSSMSIVRSVKNGNYYYVTYTYNSKEYLIRLNADTLELDESYGETEIIPTLYGYSTVATQIVIHNGYLYQMASTASSILKLIKVNIANPSDIEAIDVPTYPSNMYYTQFLTEISDGVLFWNGGYYYIATNTFVSRGLFSAATNITFSYMHFSGDGRYFMSISSSSSYKRRFGFTTNYLASINNLDSPVTKTPDKTMKITYTVTET